MNEWMCYYSIHNKQLISLIFQLLKPAHFTRTFQVFIVSDSTKLNTDENYICVPYSVTYSLLFTVASHISVFPNISKSHTACFTVWPQTSFQVHICVFSFFFFFLTNIKTFLICHCYRDLSIIMIWQPAIVVPQSHIVILNGKDAL